MFFDNEQDEQDARDCLLKYYNSEGMAHGSYVLTIAIGFFAFIQAIPYVPEISVSTFSIYGNSFKDVIIILVFSLFVTFGLYLLARTVYWGILSDYALHVAPIKYDEALKTKPVATNLIYRLNHACIAEFRNHHSNLNQFVGAGTRMKFLFRYLVIDAALIAALLIFF